MTIYTKLSTPSRFAFSDLPKHSEFAKTLGNNKKCHSSVSAVSSVSSLNCAGNCAGGLPLGSLCASRQILSGRRERARTADLCRVEATLYQLSYAPVFSN